MTRTFPPAPSMERLLQQPLHAIVRDWPESLRVLRGLGARLEERGGMRLEDAFDDPEAVARAVLESTRWRGRAGTPPEAPTRD